MKLLLQKKIKGLGEIGEIVEVANGYGRNYLLPQRLAVANTPDNRRRIEAHKLVEIKREADRLELAGTLGKVLKNALLQVYMKAQDDGTLYGAVNHKVVVDVVQKAKGVRIEERWVQLDTPIKKIGDYDIHLKMTGGAECTFKLTVLPDEEAA
jgi:large subunit ribosomal protein L9